MKVFPRTGRRRRATPPVACEVCEPRQLLSGIAAEPDALRVVAGESVDSSGRSVKYRIDAAGGESVVYDGRGVARAELSFDGRQVDVTFRGDDAPKLTFGDPSGPLTEGVYTRADGPARYFLRVGGDESFNTPDLDVVVHELAVRGDRVVRLRMTAADAGRTLAFDFTAPDFLKLNDGLTGDQNAAAEFLLAGQAPHGEAFVRPNGTFGYRPDPGFVGTDSFTYVVRSGDERSGETEVSVEVGPMDAPPPIRTAADRFEVPEGRRFSSQGSTEHVLNGSLSRRPAREVSLAANALRVRLPTGGSTELRIELMSEIGRALRPGVYEGLRNGQSRGDRPVLNLRNGSSDLRLDAGTVTVEELDRGESGEVDRLTLSYDLKGRYDRNGNVGPEVALSGQLTYVRPRSVADNDADRAGRLELVDRPRQGQVELLENGRIVYTPNEGSVGTDTFSYRRVTGLRESEPTPVTVRLRAAPVLEDRTIRVYEDKTHRDTGGRLFGRDRDTPRSALTYALMDGPSHGRIEFNEDASFVYTPDPDFAGEDTFTYTATDGLGVSEPATVTLNVVDRPDRPVFHRITEFTAQEGLPRNRGVGLVRVHDPDGGEVSLRLVGGNASRVFDFDADTGKILVKDADRLARESHPTYVLFVEAVDSQGHRRRQRLTVDVEATDDHTEFRRRSPVRVLEGESVTIPIRNLGVHDPDTPHEELLFEFTQDRGRLYTIDDTFTISSRGYGPGVHPHHLSVRVFTTERYTTSSTPPSQELRDHPWQRIDVEVYRPPQPPAVEDAEIEFARNTPLGATLGRVEAEDANGDAMTFEIVGGNESDVFRIDRRTGDVRLARDPAETVTDLRVRVTDATGLFSEATVRVEATASVRLHRPQLDVAGDVELDATIDLSREFVLLAVVGGRRLSAGEIDLSTARFGRTGWEDSLILVGSRRGFGFGIDDLDGDSYDDLIAGVDAEAAGLREGTQTVRFTARTHDGDWVRSEFRVTIEGSAS